MSKYYSVVPLLNLCPDSDVYFVIGQRGNGKTADILRNAIDDYKETKLRFVYIRRWADDIKASKSELIFTGYLLDVIHERFGEEFSVQYWRSRFYLVNGNGTKVDCIGYTLSLSESHHTKSVAYEKLKNIILDEAIQMSGERQLPDELLKFDNVLSTLIRGSNVQNNIKIWLIGNTVSKFSPYFTRFGIDINKVEQGDIKTVNIPVDEDSKQILKVTIEYCKYNKEVGDEISKYTRSDMIRKGLWEIPKTDSIPTAPNEVVKERLLFSIYEDEANVLIGCFLRHSYWKTLELDPELLLHYEKKHIREFLVLRTIERKSNYFHLSIEKSLNYHTYNDLNIMLSDIKEQTDIDFDHELYMGRVFSDNMFTADYFYNSWLKFGRVSARGLL